MCKGTTNILYHKLNGRLIFDILAILTKSEENFDISSTSLSVLRLSPLLVYVL